MSYSRFLKIMRRAGLELDVTELAEALWLAQAAPVASGPVEAGSPAGAEEKPEAAEERRRMEAAPARLSGERARTASAYDQLDRVAEGIPAAELLLPAAAPLSNSAAAAIGRALRPLARRRPSRHEREFDEEATADASGETGFLTPRFRPVPDRWFSVAVVMEETAAMAVWQELSEELERLFAGHGGFNQAERWRLRFDGEAGWLVAPNGALQPPSRLHRLGERQLIVLMSDGASPRWRDGRMAAALEGWGRVCPVVILQVVAERMWRYTQLGPPTATVKSHQPGGRNRDLTHWPRSPWQKPQPRAMAFPIVALQPALIAEWAAMLMHPGLHFTAVPLTSAPPTGEEQRDAVSPTLRAEERVENFRRLVSDEACRLAIYLSFMPLTLPVMRTVQAAMLRDESPAVLSELMLGGIIRRPDPGAPIEHPSHLRLDFHEGVRALLNRQIHADEVPPLLHLVADHISRTTGARFTISALMPYLKGDKRLPQADALRFAQFLREGLQRLGWQHLLPDSGDGGSDPGIGLPLEAFTARTVLLDAHGKETVPASLPKNASLNERSQILVTARQFIEDLGAGLKLEMVEIPGGTFTMGSPKSEAESYKDERPQHEVTVPPFYIGKFTITQAQWRIIAGWEKLERDLKPDPSDFKGDDRPVENVNWDDAKEFCARLSAKTGRGYRLPTEVEWEYACRAGTTTPFAFGETITPEIVNYDGNNPYAKAKKGKSRGETVPVGSLGVANAFGLYDMHGNVWEWCEDAWQDNYQGAPVDGSARLSVGDSSRRVLRGGSFIYNAVSCRSAYRLDSVARGLGDGVGFRVVVSAARSS